MVGTTQFPASWSWSIRSVFAWRNQLSRWRPLAARGMTFATGQLEVAPMVSVRKQKQKDNPKDVERPILPQTHPKGQKEVRRAKEKKNRNGERSKKTTIRKGG